MPLAERDRQRDVGRRVGVPVFVYADWVLGGVSIPSLCAHRPRHWGRSSVGPLDCSDTTPTPLTPFSSQSIKSNRFRDSIRPNLRMIDRHHRHTHKEERSQSPRVRASFFAPRAPNSARRGFSFGDRCRADDDDRASCSRSQSNPNAAPSPVRPPTSGSTHQSDSRRPQPCCGSTDCIEPPRLIGLLARSAKRQAKRRRAARFRV